jgi:tRNA1(Val) A37 N6-methylase TrmN6
MDKLDFMNMAKDILEETDEMSLILRGEEMKSIIDKLVEQELNFAKVGIR